MAMVDWSPSNVTAHSEMPLLSTVHLNFDFLVLNLGRLAGYAV